MSEAYNAVVRSELGKRGELLRAVVTGKMTPRQRREFTAVKREAARRSTKWGDHDGE